MGEGGERAQTLQGGKILLGEKNHNKRGGERRRVKQGGGEKN